MLVDKYDLQAPSVGFSSQTSTNDQSSGRFSVNKLPRISHTPSNHNPNHSNDLLPSTSRPGVSMPLLERGSVNGAENPIGRGPKIYTKNLPEVFTSGSVANRSKKVPSIKERNKGDSGEQMSIQVATPPGSHYFGKMKAQPIVSPAYLANIPSTKGSRKLSSQLNKYPSSMKENIEDLAFKFRRPSPSRIFKSQVNESYALSPSHRGPNTQIRDRFEYGHMFDNSLSHNYGFDKEDDVKKQIKKLIVFKKKASNTSESKFFDSKNEDVRVKLIDKASMVMAPVKIELNELITIKKVKNTARNGTIRRMLHVPSFKVFDVIEESISDVGSRENQDIKGWINTWKMNFSQAKHLARIYASFWYSPEGCVTIVCESAKNGYLSDLINLYGSLPEKCIQTAAKEILDAIIQIHSKSSKPHGNITPNEVLIDGNGRLKVMPGVVNISSIYTAEKKNSKEADENSGAFIKPSFKPNQGQFDFFPQILASNFNNALSQDIFDLGFTLLQCALGDLSTYDSLNILTLESVKSALSTLSIRSRHSACCLLHSEDLIRKTIKNSSNLLDEKKKNDSYSRRNTKPNEETEASFSSEVPHIPLIEILTSMNRFSDNFRSFLCSCLKIDPEKRPRAEDLWNHRFLSELHCSRGPQILLQEFIGITSKKERGILKSLDNEDDKELHKFEEALKVVFLNRRVKEKFESMLNRNSKQELDEKRVSEIASELGVSSHKLKRKLKECINDLQD